MKLKIVLLLLLGMSSSILFCQSAGVSGRAMLDGEPLKGVNMVVKPGLKGTSTAEDGTFLITDLPDGKCILRATLVGFKPSEMEISLKAGETLYFDIQMETDLLNLQQVTVSATRSEIALYDAPVIVSQISSRSFETTQSLSLAEGLAFSPGLRVENNCQNCGFTQLRMNGLEGAYAQVLINSRPVFSALAGVYGLDMFPANMIDRVEVVRGGGSVLYGGNAIGGTVNIITKEPVNNGFEIGLNQAFTDFDAADRSILANATLVSDDLQKGISLYGYNRNRDSWDANGDGISEMTLLENNTFGFDAFFKPNHLSKIKLGMYGIQEFRRGGSELHLAPHQTAIAEQLDHNILGASISYELYSKNFQHKWSVYSSIQSTARKSYYGNGGRITAPGDSLNERDVLALNAYGQSSDLAVAAGLQYNYDFNPHTSLTAGVELQHYEVLDEMPGYGRSIDQTVFTLGNYAQLMLKPVKKLTVLLGGRLDMIEIGGRYNLAPERLDNQQSMAVLVPRASAMYLFTENLRLRASLAQGYRAPQAFNEDLHIETVGGNVLFIQLDPALEPERSNSYTASLNYIKTDGAKQWSLLAEAFHTQLRNPFILSDQEGLAEGVSIITKRNGGAAVVQGLNFEANFAFGRKAMIQSGLTFQSARYRDAEVIWSPLEEVLTPATTTRRVLRTPATYGFLTCQYQVLKSLSVSLSSVYTGPMDLAHVVGASFADDYTVLKRSRGFFEQNVKSSWDVYTKDGYRVVVYAGLQNIFNAFQDDFDEGPERDAGYVYGPMRPRTIFFGLKFGLN